MIHQLPDPIEGQTHVQITQWTDHPASGVILRYRFGTVDAEGAFIPSRIAAERRKGLQKPTADRIRQRAADAGAPVTAGVQEYRALDLLAEMDAVGLW